MAVLGEGSSSGPGRQVGGGGQVWYLLQQRIVGAIQVELAQVVPVGEDQKWLLICR